MPKLSGAKFISNSAGAFGYAAESDATNVSDGLAVGFEIMDRVWADSAVLNVSGTIKFTYFTAPYADVSTQVRIASSGTAAATVTLIRFGLYTVAFDDQHLDLVASIPNDATIFASPNTMYTRNWSTPYTFIPGQRYAIGVLQVATTQATIAGRQPGAGFASELGLAPRLCGQLAGQSDLVTPIAAGSIVNTGGVIYAAFA